MLISVNLFPYLFRNQAAYVRILRSREVRIRAKHVGIDMVSNHMLVAPREHGRTAHPIQGQASDGPPPVFRVAQRSMGTVVHPSRERNPLKNPDGGSEDDTQRHWETLCHKRKIHSPRKDHIDGQHFVKHVLGRFVIDASGSEVFPDLLADLFVESRVRRIHRVLISNHFPNVELFHDPARLIRKGMIGSKEICRISSDTEKQHFPTTRMRIDVIRNIIHFPVNRDPRRLVGVVLSNLLP
mmetsp:Transcript_12923/g.26197  ORF Transcript_12923/g.26197 Transcript_12923/m.26197 type:complete len:240 (-) Transcript_12923:155-874(-)